MSVKLIIPVASATLSDTAALEFQRENSEVSMINGIQIGNIVDDDFSDNSFDTAKWTKTESSAGNVAEQNQRVEITANANWNANGFISVNGSNNSKQEMRFSYTANGDYMMAGLSTVFNITGGAYVYFVGDGGSLHAFVVGNDYTNIFGHNFTLGCTYNCRVVKDGTSFKMYCQSDDDANFATEHESAAYTWDTGTTVLYASFNTYDALGTSFVNSASLGEAAYSAESPTATVLDVDSGVTGTTWDMSTISNRENLASETGAIKYKYAYGDSANPSNWNASWLTLAQLQAESDVEGRYFKIQAQFISDGTQDASLQDMSITASIPGYAEGEAAQLAADQAAVNAAKASIKDDTTLLAITGTYDFTAAIAAGYSSGQATQLATDQAAVLAKAAYIDDTQTILGQAGTLDMDLYLLKSLLPDKKYLYFNIDRGDGQTGTLRASNLHTNAGAPGVDLSADILNKDSVVDDITGTLESGGGGRPEFRGANL